MVAHWRGSNRPRAAESAFASARGRGEARSAPVRGSTRARAPTPLSRPSRRRSALYGGLQAA